MTTDMFNFANDIDIYREWANIIVYNRFTTEYLRKYHCCYVGRKYNRIYAHTHEQVINSLKDILVHHEAINGVFSAALGDYGYLIRATELGEIQNAVEYIHRLA
jgi:hypothetical protein